MKLEVLIMKPLIGLIPLVDEARESLWMLPGYMDGIMAAGGLPIMLPLNDDGADLAQLCALCDGFLLTGGHDVSPEVYGGTRIAECGACSPERDRMESILLKYAMAADKPALGICRGIQFINAALGGTLWQDLPSQHPSDIEHHQCPPYDRPIHAVDLLDGTPLAKLLGVSSLMVNSYHHQAICKLAPQLEAMAVAPDGLVEAVRHSDYRFLWGVQWHPEFAWKSDPTALRILQAFVDACKDGK